METHLKCLYCGKLIDEKESLAIIEAGVEPFCSIYCANVASGVPLPYSSGAFVFDKWVLGNK